MIDWIKKWGVVRVVAPQFGKAHLGFSPQGAMDQSCLKRLKEEFEFDQEESSIWEVPSLSAKLRAQTPSFCLLVGASRPILIKNKKGLVIREQMKNQMFELDTSETLELGYSVEGVYSYLLISLLAYHRVFLVHKHGIYVLRLVLSLFLIVLLV